MHNQGPVAGGADETRLKIGQPNIIRPGIGASLQCAITLDLRPMQAYAMIVGFK